MSDTPVPILTQKLSNIGAEQIGDHLEIPCGVGMGTVNSVKYRPPTGGCKVLVYKSQVTAYPSMNTIGDIKFAKNGFAILAPVILLIPLVAVEYVALYFRQRRARSSNYPQSSNAAVCVGSSIKNF